MKPPTVIAPAVTSEMAPAGIVAGTLRVTMSRKALKKAEVSGNRMIGAQLRGGPATISTPRKPTPTAAHRRTPTRSLRTSAASAVTMIGATKNSVAVSPSGRCASARK